MEREILFRAIRLDNGEWIIGSLIITSQKDEKGQKKVFILKGNCTGYAYTFQVDPETVGQLCLVNKCDDESDE